MLYFAYGSNMCTARLRSRAPSATVVGPARLLGHVLRFHKRARDGSAKCDAAPGDGAVHGILFALDADDWAGLDRAEGRGVGYERVAVEVETSDGSVLAAQAYRAQDDYIDAALLPYTWYRDLVAAGAREHDLPRAWIEGIERQPAVVDPDPQREARARAWL